MSNRSTIHYPIPELVSTEWQSDVKPSGDQPAPAASQRYGAYEELGGPRISLQWVHDQEVVSMPTASFYLLIGKRILDIVVAGFVTLFILSWMIPLVATLILCETPGPFFFIQGRSGRRGIPFPCLKFRTMVHGKPASGFQQTRRDDARVTKIGRFLRKTNLDEMPQFINVLLGDMSLVGPRPHAVQHDAMHWASPAYRERYWVRPGITGLAQIRGARGATGHQQRMDHRVRYDHFYIPRQTFLLDVKICLLTLKLMFRGDVNAW